MLIKKIDNLKFLSDNKYIIKNFFSISIANIWKKNEDSKSRYNKILI